MTESNDLLNRRFRLNPRYRLQWEDAQNCHVLLYPEGLIRLNESAAEILRRCLQPVTAAELIESLREDFPEADLEDDVREFLSHAGQQEWIVREDH